MIDDGVTFCNNMDSVLWADGLVCHAPGGRESYGSCECKWTVEFRGRWSIGIYDNREDQPSQTKNHGHS